MATSAESALVSRIGRVASRDGTTIAYDAVGNGPPVVAVDGAFCTRTMRSQACLIVSLDDSQSAAHGRSRDAPCRA